MTSIRAAAVLMTALSIGVLITHPALADRDLPAITAVCAGCHGEGGVSSNPFVPTLAGQPFTVIEDNLLAFRNGNRACAAARNDGSPAALMAQTMCASVQGLSDREIEAIAEYFESRSFEPAQQDFQARLAEQGGELHREKGCEGCHSGGGTRSNQMAPILAGQWTPYLRRAMEALKSGDRRGPKVMNAAIHELDSGEIEALMNYYASQGNGGTLTGSP